MAFNELRQYKVLPGKLDEWVRIMEDEIIPFQVSKGVVICGSFCGETDGANRSMSGCVALTKARPSARRSTKRSTESDYWKKRNRAARSSVP